MSRQYRRSALDRLADVKVEWVPEYKEWRFESWLLDFDATGLCAYPEDGSFGYLYVLGLSDDWIKVGRTGKWAARQSSLRGQFRQRHTLSIEQVWKTVPIPAAELAYAEARVKAYARRLADGSRLFYARGDGRVSEETEMFHAADFGLVRAYADVIGRCEVLW
ncbi:hypothetical protein [Nocardia sp. X0981]